MRFFKGQIPWNKGMKGFGAGHKPYFCAKGSSNSFWGRKHTAETLEKMRLAKLGKRGIETNHWKGGVSRDTHSLTNPDYKRWRNEVFKRDGFKCKMSSGECGIYIEAHHILSWSEYPELRFIINNGITLCRAHHPRGRAKEKRLIPLFKGLVSVSNDSHSF